MWLSHDSALTVSHAARWAVLNSSFLGLFSELDSQPRLGIVNYGVSMTTLEDVFLRLEAEAEVDQAGECVAKLTIAADFSFSNGKSLQELWRRVKVVSCLQTTACLIESRRTTSATPPPWTTRTRGCSRSPTQSRTLWRVTPCGGSSSAPWRGCTCSTCAGRGRPSFTRECSPYFTLLANFFILKISWVNRASYLLP